MRKGNGSLPKENGTPVAFSHLMVEAQVRLSKVAYSLTKNRDQANDLVQDCMLRALECEDQFIEGTSFLAWTTVIMRNIHFNRFRQYRQRSKVHPAAVTEASVCDYTKNCARGCPDGALELPKVLQTFKLIPGINHDALDLIVFKEKSYDEAADLLHISPVTVRTRMLRGRDALLRHYDPQACRKLPTYRTFRPHLPKPKPDANHIRELRLQKCTLKDIATEMQCGVAAVRATLHELKMVNPDVSDAVKRSWIKRREKLRRYYA